MGKDTKSTILNQADSQRNTFFTEVYKMMHHDKDIIIVVADMSTPVFDKIREDFPHRFFNVGIAEQHAVTLAAGMACEGLKPIVAIYSTFLQRAYDQLRQKLEKSKMEEEKKPDNSAFPIFRTSDGKFTWYAFPATRGPDFVRVMKKHWP